jgi:alpha-ketoglutarate-dependent taurine dioxygenase
VRALVERVADEHAATGGELAAVADAHAEELPAAVRAALEALRDGEIEPALIVGGNPIDDDRLGPTPGDWRAPSASDEARRMEVLLVLYGALLGRVFGWDTQQGGRLVHDVMPIAGREDEQIGFSSRAPLSWHTEDAYFDDRPDYVGLLCLRNPDAVATTVAGAAGLTLAGATRAVLGQERFRFRPDGSHELDGARAAAVLSGDPAAPRLRIDPDFTDAAPGDDDAAAALGELTRALEAALEPLVLAPGDVCLLDNHRVVHGRAAFRARGDGRDRWLKRVLVATRPRTRAP